MNKWQKIGLAVGMGAAVVTTTHLINSIIFKSSTANNYTGKRIRSNYQWKFGNIAYITAGSGSPLLLIHDLNSYSSSYEWEQTINSFAKNHKVYAIDLLGCGHSDKPNLTYTSFMYTQLINDFVVNVIRCKTDVIATAASTPIVIMAAFNNHALFNKIILVSPLSVEEALKGPDNLSGIRRHILNVPVIGTTVYNILFNKPSLKKASFKNISRMVKFLLIISTHAMRMHILVTQLLSIYSSAQNVILLLLLSQRHFLSLITVYT